MNLELTQKKKSLLTSFGMVNHQFHVDHVDVDVNSSIKVQLAVSICNQFSHSTTVDHVELHNKIQTWSHTF